MKNEERTEKIKNDRLQIKLEINLSGRATACYQEDQVWHHWVRSSYRYAPNNIADLRQRIIHRFEEKEEIQMFFKEYGIPLIKE